MIKNESVADGQNPPPESSADGPRIEIASDEDWKSRVKAEDAALDQQYRGEPSGGSGRSDSGAEAGSTPATETAGSAAPEARPAEPQTAREMPQPTFGDLVGLMSAQAMMFLGLIPNPSTQKAETQLATARYFIDMIGILEEKTKGQLTKEESQILDDTLHSLRITFMQLSKQTA